MSSRRTLPTTVTRASVIIQNANWRSALSATLTLSGARKAPSRRRYRRIVTATCGAAAWSCAHSAAAVAPAPAGLVAGSWRAGRSRAGHLLHRQHRGHRVLVGVD